MKTVTDVVIPVDTGEAVRAKCPYCGHNNMPFVEHRVRRLIFLCDVEEGGCDRWFYIEIQRQAITTSYAIEGQEVQS